VLHGSSPGGCAFVLAVAAAGAIACRATPPAAGDYLARVQTARASKDAQLTSSNAPLPESRKAHFLPLAYYPVEPSYRVPGVLKPSAESPTLMMPTSTGSQQPMRRVGSLEFTLKGEPMTLAAFTEVGVRDASRLFVPFTDMTTGTETYPAGRYMDLDRSSTGLYEVDFNYAYHPYCYFNETYSCPFPPAENRLQLPIRAGERLKK
jgi:uncharacterized protein (DUF1684 family)